MAKVNFWYAGSFDPHAENHTPSAVLDGLSKVGFSDINHVSQNGFRESEWMDCDLCVVYGMRGNGKQIIEAHNKRGVQAIVIDLGYISRAMKSNGYNGYWQVSLNGLNWLPPKASNDRFKRLGLNYPKHSKRDGYVLLAEQTPNDASHGMDLDALSKWMDNAVSMCEAANVPYKKRRHPMNGFIPDDEKPTTTIEQDLAGASCVYVHNSNAGNDALLAGIPVICDQESIYKPTYYDLVGKEINNNPQFPKEEIMKNYLHRLAYAQWTREEIREGKALEYVINQM